MSPSTQKRLVATDSMAVASGVITYWALSGTVKYEALQQAWAAQGMDEHDLIQPPSALVALRRAIERVAPEKSIVKPLKEEEGYTVIRKTVEVGAAQKWETDFSAFIATSGKLTVFVEGFTTPGGEREMQLAGEIEDYLDMELGMLHSIDISNWLVRMADRLRAVSLRESGGFYFIPRGPDADYWDKIAIALQTTSAVRVLSIPAMHSEQASLAVVQALTDEIHSSTKNLQTALDEARMGRRALDTKIGSCTNMLDKIATYEELLGEKLNTLREAVDGLKAKYVEAWVVADAVQE